ncbi:GNAT family N-acetyltransferase [Bacillus sp. sid0103]|uniref:GNAT family N-acetyltransferase n=1 Tax=Bacillus sp. sid0103 TaxID=2856337 RepID=UPI001C4863E7|nr:GNAT family N-acetyltransferase [Bacillus sp. sid0103]MBV7506191.1 GNAT family N-acetyltransferase [Bacillus sp. sid0103]
MNHMEIRRPEREDQEELSQFFRIVITDTFAKEGLAEMVEEIEQEIELKMKYVQSDLESNGENRYFLIALDHSKIIGTIEYGAASDLITSCTDGALKELVEIGTVFVHPDFQRNGVGNLLLNAMFRTLEKKDITEFCLDSGYTNAQKIWKKKFGAPEYLLKDYWGEGFDHMIWRVKTYHHK